MSRKSEMRSNFICHVEPSSFITVGCPYDKDINGIFSILLQLVRPEGHQRANLKGGARQKPSRSEPRNRAR